MPGDCFLNIQSFNKGDIPLSITYTVKKPSSKNFFQFIQGVIIIICTLLSYISWPFNYYSFVNSVVFTSSFMVGAFVFFKFIWTTHEETIILSVPISLQLSTTYYIGITAISYIPWKEVKDLAILEIITGQRVLFFLAVMLKTPTQGKKHIILFKGLTPRLAILEQVYQSAQHIIDFYR